MGCKYLGVMRVRVMDACRDRQVRAFADPGTIAGGHAVAKGRVSIRAKSGTSSPEEAAQLVHLAGRKCRKPNSRAATESAARPSISTCEVRHTPAVHCNSIAVNMWRSRVKT